LIDAEVLDRRGDGRSTGQGYGCAVPSAPDLARSAGPVVLIGGAEDKVGRSRVLRRVLRLAGARPRVALLPTASAIEDEVVAVYAAVLARLGAGRVDAVRPADRVRADDPALAAVVGTADVVLITGGNQLKLSQVLGGTAVEAAVHAAHRRGAVVAGTSAGASVLSRYMPAHGGEGATPRHRASQLSAGFGLLEDVVVDQHFDQRGRYGRLMSLVAASPALLGLGVDEDTAAVVTGRRWLEVVGAGGVFVLDARGAVSDAHEARRGAPLLLSGAVVHTLPAGARFDLERRTLVAFSERHPARDVPQADVEEVRALAARLRAQLRRGDEGDAWTAGPVATTGPDRPCAGHAPHPPPGQEAR
jgi:cyanophycinase